MLDHSGRFSELATCHIREDFLGRAVDLHAFFDVYELVISFLITRMPKGTLEFSTTPECRLVERSAYPSKRQ
jgi:hypothetical protein